MNIYRMLLFIVNGMVSFELYGSCLSSWKPNAYILIVSTLLVLSERALKKKWGREFLTRNG